MWLLYEDNLLKYQIVCVCSQEAHKMVREANVKQANAEKQLKEALGKVTTRNTEHWKLCDSISQPENHRKRMIHVQNLPENHHNFNFSLASK